MTILRPKIELLDKDHKIQIFNEAISILETQGVFIENKEVIELFSKVDEYEKEHPDSDITLEENHDD